MERIRAYIREKVFPMIAMDDWVSDGFYPHLQEEIAKRADVILYLDTPLWRRLLNHAQRLSKPSSRHGELTTWDEIKFFFEIVRRTYANTQKHKIFLEEYADKVLILKSRKEIAAYVEGLSL